MSQLADPISLELESEKRTEVFKTQDPLADSSPLDPSPCASKEETEGYSRHFPAVRSYLMSHRSHPPSRFTLHASRHWNFSLRFLVEILRIDAVLWEGALNSTILAPDSRAHSLREVMELLREMVPSGKRIQPWQ